VQGRGNRGVKENTARQCIYMNKSTGRQGQRETRYETYTIGSVQVGN